MMVMTIGLTDHVFRQRGAKVVFFGRFVAVLRAWAALLAGTNRMPWGRFLPYNAAGGIVWATLYGLGGYVLGNNVTRLAGPAGIGLSVIAALPPIGFLFVVKL